MALKKAKKKGLQNIVYHLRHAHNFLIKAFWYLFGFYYGGALKERYQFWFAKKIHWKPKNLTIVNIIIFGFGGALLYFTSKEHAMIFISLYFASWLSSIFHLAINNILFIYVIYNLIQSFFRLIYVEVTKRPIASFNLFGLIANVIHYLVVVFHRDVLKQKHEFHG